MHLAAAAPLLHKAQHAKNYRCLRREASNTYLCYLLVENPYQMQRARSIKGWAGQICFWQGYRILRPSMECENQVPGTVQTTKQPRLMSSAILLQRNAWTSPPLVFMRAVAFRRSFLECACLKLAFPHSLHSFSKQRRRDLFDSADFT